MSSTQKTVYVAFNEFTPPIKGQIMIENETEALVRCEDSYTDGVCGDHPDEYQTWEVHLPLGTHWVKKEKIFNSYKEAEKKYAFWDAKQKFEKYKLDLKQEALEIQKQHEELLLVKKAEIKKYQDLDSLMDEKYEYRDKLWEKISELEAKKRKLEEEVLTLENFKQILAK